MQYKQGKNYFPGYISNFSNVSIYILYIIMLIDHMTHALIMRKCTYPLSHIERESI